MCNVNAFDSRKLLGISAHRGFIAVLFENKCSAFGSQPSECAANGFSGVVRDDVAMGYDNSLEWLLKQAVNTCSGRLSISIEDAQKSTPSDAPVEARKIEIKPSWPMR